MYTLKSDCIDVKPVNYDWSEGYGEEWDVCHNLISTVCGNKYRDDDREEWEPMMNYYYPLPYNFDPDDYEEIYNLMNNCTIIDFNGDYALALTGGGMDLSWEICETYINLGYYPPVHFCDLPKMAGRGESAKDKKIVKACKESLEIMSNWLKNRSNNLCEI